MPGDWDLDSGLTINVLFLFTYRQIDIENS